MGTKAERKAVPRVFLSSTADDLGDFRDRVDAAIRRLGMHPVRHEYNPASGDVQAYAECMRRVRETDVLVVIAAHWYGWIPEDQPAADEGPGQKSITWLEAEEARTNDIDVLGFIAKPEAGSWPHKKELDAFHNLAPAEYGTKGAEIGRRIELLESFKKELNRYQRGTFTSPADLAENVGAALSAWKERKGLVTAPVETPADARPYLEALARETREISLRAIQRAPKTVRPLDITEVYVPLTYKQARAEAQPRHWKARVHEGFTDDLPTETAGDEPPQPLESALHPAPAHVLYVGDPGTGKTTFTRRLAYEACQSLLDEPIAAAKRLLPDEPRFPVHIKLSSLAEFIAKSRSRPQAPAGIDATSPEWLPLYVAAWSKEKASSAVAAGYVRNQLDVGAFVLLDGLDEVAETRRASTVDLLEQLPLKFPNSSLIVTSRGSAFGGVVSMSGFRSLEVSELTDGAVEKFTEVWCRSIHDDEVERQPEQAKLLDAVRNGEIARMARNPLMLTCLALLVWNKRELPDRRAELYALILEWLAGQREGDGRPKADQRLALYRQLALAMHTAGKARAVEWPSSKCVNALTGDKAARHLDASFEPKAAARRFLQQDESDSGIIARGNRDNSLKFWHQQFQEYLAAAALLDRDSDRRHQLFERNRLHEADWRDTILLMAGEALARGWEWLDEFLDEIVNELGDSASLEERARALVLIGAMLRDIYSAKYKYAGERLPALRDQVMEIFTAEGSKALNEKLRVDAGDAIGIVGDPRFAAERLEENWVLIPEGSFRMGAQKTDKAGRNYDPDADGDEAPVREVHVSAFEIGRYPVTVGEYARFVEAGGYTAETWWQGGGFGKFGDSPRDWAGQVRYSNRPVTEVSWFEAVAYAAWLSAKEGRTVRLPTEAEWEKTARHWANGGRYPWGKADPDGLRANYARRAGHASPAGLYPVGAGGEVLDLAGNVLEWCGDWFADDAYRTSGERDPTGPTNGNTRVIRGGSWGYNPRDLRVSYRGRGHPGVRFNFIGFRCVREVFP